MSLTPSLKKAGLELELEAKEVARKAADRATEADANGAPPLLLPWLLLWLPLLLLLLPLRDFDEEDEEKFKEEPELELELVEEDDRFWRRRSSPHCVDRENCEIFGPPGSSPGSASNDSTNQQQKRVLFVSFFACLICCFAK